VKPVDDVVFFAVELAALVAFGVWGWHVGAGPGGSSSPCWCRWCSPWRGGVLAAPNSARRLTDPALVVFQLVAFLLAAAALWTTGRHGLGAALGVVAVVVVVLDRVLARDRHHGEQRGPDLLLDPRPPAVAVDPQAHRAAAVGEVAVTEVHPEQVGVGLRIERRRTAAGAERRSRSPGSRSTVLTAPVLDGAFRDAEGHGDLANTHARREHPARPLDGFRTVHGRSGECDHRQFGAPGGIRTHTVRCLRPLSLPVGLRGLPPGS
jgi:hypothetical protein